MDMYLGKSAYLAKKLEIKEKCLYSTNGQACGNCGVCFWTNITICPDDIPECRKCVRDLDTLKIKLNGKKNVHIKFTAECCHACIQWDWFHNKRLQMSKNYNCTFEYERKKKN